MTREVVRVRTGPNQHGFGFLQHAEYSPKSHALMIGHDKFLWKCDAITRYQILGNILHSANPDPVLESDKYK